MYPKTVSWLPALALVPFLGALLNGLFGRKLGRTFVTIFGVGAPAVAFAITAAFFAAMTVRDRHVLVQGPRETIDRVSQSLDDEDGATYDIEDDPTRLDPNPSDQVFLRVFTIRKVVPTEGLPPEQWPTVVDAASVEALEEKLKDIGGLRIGQSKDFGASTYTADLGSWISFADLDIRFRFVLDRLAIVMCLVITGVGTLIHIYSTRYMEHEDAGGFARYFSYLNLFVGSMLILVLGGDLLLMFVGWEGVGLCSYLLIGFHYKDPANAACGSKAFIVNRIGDFGFVLGVLALLVMANKAVSGSFSADIATINGLAATGALDPTWVGVACLLLFLGATGKSAQIPLHLWLPDAMAGPTPVSALIHAATMVTAGIYMIARLSPVFEIAQVTIFDESVGVLSIIAIVGVATAFFAGTAALGQDDIKRVLAYSTVSQLGYMFVGVGAMAYGAAVFHLVTHAFFKALLFLAAGSVIHATHTQSMREMGGLRRYMPVTFLTMTIGALALAAFPLLLSGFYSKDLILAEVLARGYVPGASQGWSLIYSVGVLTGAVTAVYSMRMILLTFGGEYRGRHTPHESPPAMTAPLVILAVLTIAASVLGLPEVFTHDHPLLPAFLETVVAPGVTVVSGVTPGMMQVTATAYHDIEVLGLIIGAVAAVLGLAIGFAVWRSPDNPWEVPTPGGAIERTRNVLARAWLYDDIVNKRGLQPAVKYFSHVMWRWIDDETVDRGMVDGVGRVGAELSTFTRAFQVGRVARYAGYFTIGAVLIPLIALVLVPHWQDFLGLFAGSGSGSGH